MNNILHERQLEEYYCTLCYASFDFKRRLVTMANSGLPYPIRCTAEGCAQIELPGVPLGSFPGTTYDEATYSLAAGRRVRVLLGRDLRGDERGRRGVHLAAADRRSSSGRATAAPRTIVDAIFETVEAFRGEAIQNDDMTAVAIKITA